MKARRRAARSRGHRRATAAMRALLLAGASVVLLSPPVGADSARLTLDVAALSFPSADPDVVPQVSALENPVTVEVTLRAGNPSIADLTVVSLGHLQSGADVIPIGRVSWTANGHGFTSGALSRNDPQPVGQWFGKRVDAVGTLWFQLENSWDYATGSYTQTLVYTLTSY